MKWTSINSTNYRNSIGNPWNTTFSLLIQTWTIKNDKNKNNNNQPKRN